MPMETNILVRSLCDFDVFFIQHLIDTGDMLGGSNEGSGTKKFRNGDTYTGMLIFQLCIAMFKFVITFRRMVQKRDAWEGNVNSGNWRGLFRLFVKLVVFVLCTIS